MRRTVLLLAVMAAVLVMASGVALAQPRGGDDVCVSHEGERLYDRGPSQCFSDPNSTAVAIDHSFAFAENDSEAMAINHSVADAFNHSEAVAINDSSFAFADKYSEAVAINHSEADALDHCTATAVNGEEEVCP